MHISNQQSSTGTHHIHFTPIATSCSSVGTTVTYGIPNTTAVNAYNTAQAVSGQAGGYYATPWSTTLWSANPWSTVPYNTMQPVITAGYYNQPISGTMFAYGQPRQFIAGSWSPMVQPTVDISETSSDVVVSAYVPNVDINNLSLNVTENSVTISASAWTGNQNVVINRTVALPTSIRADSVDASIQNSGVLEIRLPKVEKGIRNRTAITQTGSQIGQ
jgi:HSP20 family molecular chaperone IbpA